MTRSIHTRKTSTFIMCSSVSGLKLIVQVVRVVVSVVVLLILLGSYVVSQSFLGFCWRFFRLRFDWNIFCNDLRGLIRDLLISVFLVYFFLVGDVFISFLLVTSCVKPLT